MVGRWLRSQLLLVAVIILQCSTTIDGSKCVDKREYDFVDGNCVYVSHPSVQATFEEAIVKCQARNIYPLNWTLAKVDTWRKHERLVEIRTLRTSDRHFWIGLRRDNTTTEDEKIPEQWRTTWRWVRDGSTLDSSSFPNDTAPWATAVPDDRDTNDERCVFMSSVWYDTMCRHNKSFFCESIDVSTTTTSTTSTTTATTTTTSTSKTTTITTTSTATIPTPTTPTTAVPTTTATTTIGTSAEESPKSASVLFSTTTSIGISNSTPQKAKEATTPNHLAIGLGIGIAGLFIALIMIAILIVGIIHVRRRRRRRAFRAGSDMTTRIFSEIRSDQSGIFKLDDREKLNKGAKKGSEESSYSAVLPPSKMESSLSMKRESPKKKKGPSASLKKLYEKWAAIDAREAKTIEMTKTAPENLPHKKSGKSSMPNTNLIKSNVPKKQPGKLPAPGSTAVCLISTPKKSKGAKVSKQSGYSLPPSNKSEALSKRPGKMPSPLARLIISTSKKSEDVPK